MEILAHPMVYNETVDITVNYQRNLGIRCYAMKLWKYCKEEKKSHVMR